MKIVLNKNFETVNTCYSDSGRVCPYDVTFRGVVFLDMPGGT